MNKPRRGRFEEIAYQPGWRNPLPPALRLAAELQFGTLFFAAVIAGVKEGIVAAASMLFVTAMAFTHLRLRCANSPAAWWFGVVLYTAFGVLACVLALTL